MKPPNFTEAKEKYLGKTFQSKSYGVFKIVDYTSTANVRVIFPDTGYETITHMGLIKRGEVKDCFKPTVQGFGIIGKESIRDSSGKILDSYRKWESMLDRVYGRGCKADKTNPYHSVYISEDFRWFKNFKDWCYEQIGFEMKGWVLDKDILVKGNKFYSPEACCFVPAELNSLLVNNRAVRGSFPVGVYYDKSRNNFQAYVRVNGKRKNLGRYQTSIEAFLAYKKAKEAYIKEVVNKWKDKIDPRVYEALMSWEICYYD